MKNIFYLVMLLHFFNGCKTSAKVEKQEIKIEEPNNVQLEEKTIETIANNNLQSNTDTVKKSGIIYDNSNPRNFILTFSNSSGKRDIDLREINPYNNLSDQIDYVSKDSFDFWYDLGNESDFNKTQILKNIRINEDAHRENLKYLKAFVKTPEVEIKNDKAFVGYHISYYSSDEDILGTQGVVMVFNDNGEIVTKIEDLNDGVYEIRVSEDGKYLLQKYGINYGEDGSGQLRRGFKFYSAESGKKLYEFPLGKDEFITWFDFFPNSNYLFNFSREEGDIHEYYMLDFLNKKVYLKSLNRKKFSNDINYRNSILTNFNKERSTNSLLKDGFKKLRK